MSTRANAMLVFVGIIAAVVAAWVAACAMESHSRISLGPASVTKTRWVAVSAETTYYKYMDTTAMMRVCTRYARVPEEK